MIKESCFGFSACLPSFVPKLWFVFFLHTGEGEGGGLITPAQLPGMTLTSSRGKVCEMIDWAPPVGTSSLPAPFEVTRS